MNRKGIGQQGLGVSTHNGLWIGSGDGGRAKSSPNKMNDLSGVGKITKKEMIKREDGSYSERGLWDNIRDNKGSGKKPTKAMLVQAKKIKTKE